MAPVREAAGLFDQPLKISIVRRVEADGSWRVRQVLRRGAAVIDEIAMDRATARAVGEELIAASG